MGPNFVWGKTGTPASENQSNARESFTNPVEKVVGTL